MQTAKNETNLRVDLILQTIGKTARIQKNHREKPVS